MINNDVFESLKGFNIRLKSRPGVFSKNKIDEGSRLLIENVEIKNGTLIADLGCGSGIIGIIAAKLNPKGHVDLFDVNLRMIELSKTNIELNQVKNAEVFISDLFSAVGDKNYHQILSNPPLHLGNDFLNECMSECYKHLKPESSVVLVVQKHLKPYVEKLLESYFGNSKVVARGQKHIVIKAERSN